MLQMRPAARLGLLLGIAWAGASGAMTAGGPQDDAVPAEPGTETALEETPTFRGGINVVQVDAIVLDRDDQPVLDLTADDFEIREDGEPQRIESFRLIQVDEAVRTAKDPPRVIRSTSDEEIEADRDATRLVAIFLDDYHVRRVNSMKVRRPLREFIETQLSPFDMVAVMYPLTPISTIRFTRNHDVIARAIDQFQGRKYEYEVTNDFENRYAHYPTWAIEKIRLQVTMSAVKALLSRLGGLREGRKTLLFVTEGFPAALPPQLTDPAAATGGGASFAPDAFSLFNAEIDIDMDLREVSAVANRNNAAIYALDPRGLTGEEFGLEIGNVSMDFERQILNQTINGLRSLAEDTDGRAIVNQNDLAGGLEQIRSDSSSYYLMSYTLADPPQDGKFHEIDVRVTRPGVKVRSRPGYWALSERDTIRLTTPAPPGPPEEVTAALGTLAAATRGRVVQTWFGLTPGADGRTRLTLVWEPTASAGDHGAPPVRVRVTASSADGDLYYRGEVPDGSDDGPGGESRRQVSFEVDPGVVQLSLAVEGDDSSVLDREVRDVEVADLAADAVRIGTPWVFRTRSVAEFRAVAEDPEATPSVTRRFSRRERLLIRFGVHGREAPAPSVRLLSRVGDPMRDLEVQPSQVGDQQYDVDLPLSGLAAGDYVIELSAGEVSEFLGIRVAG